MYCSLSYQLKRLQHFFFIIILLFFYQIPSKIYCILLSWRIDLFLIFDVLCWVKYGLIRRQLNLRLWSDSVIENKNKKIFLTLALSWDSKRLCDGLKTWHFSQFYSFKCKYFSNQIRTEDRTLVFYFYLFIFYKKDGWMDNK